MKNLPFFFAVVALFLIPIRTEASLSSQDISARTKVCQGLNPDLERMNQCYFNLAVEADDVNICEQIRWNFKQAACKRKLLYENKWHPGNIVRQSPVYILLLVFAFYVLKKPPRSPYLQGALIGAFIAASLLFIETEYFGWMTTVKGAIPYIRIPVQGFLTFMPDAFIAYPYPAQFFAVHIVWYGLVVGLILRWEKDLRQYILFFIVVSVVLTFFEHPVFSFIHDAVEVLRS